MVIVETMVVDEEEWQAWAEQEQQAASQKRQRTSGGGGGGGQAAGRPTPPSHPPASYGGGARGTSGGSSAFMPAIGAPIGAPAAHPVGVAGGTLTTELAVAEDSVLVPRSLLATMIDQVERASLAAQGAVSLSTQARNAFEDEHKRLTEILQQLRSSAAQGRYA